jgi:hypothetical protein
MAKTLEGHEMAERCLTGNVGKLAGAYQTAPHGWKDAQVGSGESMGSPIGSRGEFFAAKSAEARA